MQKRTPKDNNGDGDEITNKYLSRNMKSLPINDSTSNRQFQNKVYSYSYNNELHSVVGVTVGVVVLLHSLDHALACCVNLCNFINNCSSSQKKNRRWLTWWWGILTLSPLVCQVVAPTAGHPPMALGTSSNRNTPFPCSTIRSCMWQLDDMLGVMSCGGWDGVVMVMVVFVLRVIVAHHVTVKAVELQSWVQNRSMTAKKQISGHHHCMYIIITYTVNSWFHTGFRVFWTSSSVHYSTHS